MILFPLLYKVLSDDCLKKSCSEDDLERLHKELGRVLSELATSGFGLSGFPRGLLYTSVRRFLLHNDSSVKRVDGSVVPAALRGSPDLSLSWTLLNSVEYFATHCSVDGAPSNHLCHSIARGNSDGLESEADLTALAITTCGIGGLKKSGEEYNARDLNQLPLRRVALAQWVLSLAGNNDFPHFGASTTKL